MAVRLEDYADAYRDIRFERRGGAFPLGYGLALEGFASGYGAWGSTLHTERS